MMNIESFFNTSNIKRFFFPGKIFWGKDCRYCLFNLVDPDKTIALFVDRFFAQNKFVKELQKRYAKQIILKANIESMPKTDNIKRIITQLGRVPDMVISIGGGSSIDTAKAVIASFIYGTFDGIGIGARRVIKTIDDIAKPIFISLPTTPGTGADASRYYVVYDSDTHIKVHGKSWALVADWILIDAYFIRNLPDRLLINSAFDAFIHFFESYLCRYERSWLNDMLSLDGMLRIISSLDQIIYRKNCSDGLLLQLLYASTIAGVAISNVRTGIIHEAGGALLEHTKLTHPETLFVFLRSVYKQYNKHTGNREDMLLQRLKSEYPQLECGSLEGVIEWWERLYEITGITMSIIKVIKKTGIPSEELKRYIFDRVYSDKVWIEKEGPFPLDENLIYDLINNSLARFGLER